MGGLSRRSFLALGSLAAASHWAATALPCCASPQWVDYRTYGPFQVQATFPLQPLTPVFNELGSLDFELQRTLAVPPTQHTVQVYLFHDEPTYRETLRQVYPAVPDRRALYLQRSGESSIYAYRNPELAVDLRHESTHALLHTKLPMVPLWLDEGLAEYFEMPEAERAFGHPHLRKVRLQLRFGMYRDIESLEQCRVLEDMGEEEYRFSWAWVHFMLHGPLPAHRALVHYLRDIQRGDPPGVLSERLHASVPNLDKQLAYHFRNWKR